MPGFKREKKKKNKTKHTGSHVSTEQKFNNILILHVMLPILQSL